MHEPAFHPGESRSVTAYVAFKDQNSPDALRELHLRILNDLAHAAPFRILAEEEVGRSNDARAQHDGESIPHEQPMSRECQVLRTSTAVHITP